MNIVESHHSKSKGDGFFYINSNGRNKYFMTIA